MDRRWVRPIGRALRGLRAGMAGLASHRFSGVAESIRLTSPVFGHGTDIPEKFTADGAGVSPPLAWEGVPVGTRSLVLLVEDPDVPVPVPVVHALVYGMPTTLTELGEGAIPSGSDGTGRHGFRLGRSGLGRIGWVPPSPPPGHGPHHYAFQMFALDCSPSFEWPPGRIALLRQMDRHVLGFGVLFGVYERV
jgi:Raf kinase inhibitor-like YbhB/YbcL family protein